jgi:hypothetical protein
MEGIKTSQNQSEYDVAQQRSIVRIRGSFKSLFLSELNALGNGLGMIIGDETAAIRHHRDVI